MVDRAVFDGGSGGFDPRKRELTPQKVLQNLFGGIDSNPLRTPPHSIFLLNQYNYVTITVLLSSV